MNVKSDLSTKKDKGRSSFLVLGFFFLLQSLCLWLNAMNRIDDFRQLGKKLMIEAHLLVIINRWGKCRLSTVPLNTGNDGTTAGLPQALDRYIISYPIAKTPVASRSRVERGDDDDRDVKQKRRVLRDLKQRALDDE